MKKKNTTTLYDLIEFLLLVEAKEAASEKNVLKQKKTLKEIVQMEKEASILSQIAQSSNSDKVIAPSKPKKSLGTDG